MGGAVQSERLTKPCAACGGECAGRRRVRDRDGRYFHRACYEKQVGPPIKPCTVCGWECAGRPRVRDRLGRYFHNACYEKAKRRTQAKREAAAAARPAAAPPAPAPEIPAEAAPDRREYARPVVLMLAGALVCVITLLVGADTPGSGVTRGVGSAVVSLTVLALCAVLGAVVVGLAAKAWRGDCGPMTLILLRVAGIYAVLAAIALLSVVTVPGGLGGFGLIVSIVVVYGLTAWLFKLASAQIVMLTLFAIGLNLLAGLTLMALATAG